MSAEAGAIGLQHRGVVDTEQVRIGAQVAAPIGGDRHLLVAVLLEATDHRRPQVERTGHLGEGKALTLAFTPQLLAGRGRGISMQVLFVGVAHGGASLVAFSGQGVVPRPSSCWV